MENDITKRQVGLFIAFALIIVAIIVLIVLSFTSIGAKNEKPQQNLEVAAVEVVKTHLTLYYAENGAYPVTEKELAEYINEKSEDITYTDVESGMKDLDYSVRGDGEAYKVTYENFKGEDKSFEGNYQNDYN